MRGPSFDGLVGFETVRMAREAIGLSIAAERFGASFFSNGATFGGLVSFRACGRQTRSRRPRERRWRCGIRAPTAPSSCLALWNGAKYTEDRSVSERRGNSTRPGCSRFEKSRGLQDSGGAARRSRAVDVQQSRAAICTRLTNCLRPWLVRVEQELMAKLIRAIGARHPYNRTRHRRIPRGRPREARGILRCHVVTRSHDSE